MVGKLLARVAFVAVAAACSSAFAAEEMVENPAYKNWAQYKPGTTVTYKTTTAMTMGENTMNQDMSMTQTLVSVDKEKVTVEMVLEMTMGGNTRKMPAQKQSHNATIEKSKVDAGMIGAQGDAKVTNVKDGKDTVEVKGAKVDTVTKEMDVEMTQQGQTIKSHVKTWVSEKVPGGVVKMTMDATEPMKMTMNMAVTDYTTK